MLQYTCPVFEAISPNPLGGMSDRLLARLPGTDHDGTLIPAEIDCVVISDDGETMTVEIDEAVVTAPADWTEI